MNPTRKERIDAYANLMEIPYTGNDSYTAWLYVADALNIDDENALLPGGWRLIVTEIARLIDSEPERTCSVEPEPERICHPIFGECDLCKWPLRDGALYCDHCGARIEVVDDAD